ncbi:hypothetical protein PYCC9005_002917 [Savitreella phatthalungensis]
MRLNRTFAAFLGSVLGWWAFSQLPVVQAAYARMTEYNEDSVTCNGRRITGYSILVNEWTTRWRHYAGFPGQYGDHLFTRMYNEDGDHYLYAVPFDGSVGDVIQFYWGSARWRRWESSSAEWHSCD